MAAERWITPDQDGLRGEGSIPVSLPPPDWPNAGYSPGELAGKSFELRPPDRQSWPILLQKARYLRSSGLRPFGTVLEIRTFGAN